LYSKSKKLNGAIFREKIYDKKLNRKIITFHKKDLLKYDELKLSKKYKVKELIKISNAR